MPSNCNSKKHAILIMAHNQFEILEKLMIQLDHERNDIYIHIDRKSRGFEQRHFEHICKKSKVVFIPRMSVHWGDSSQTKCELRLIEAALSTGEEYLYLHLLSGSDLQIKQTAQIHDFFDEHPGNQFLALRNTISGLSGISRYYFFLPLRSYNKYIAKGLDIISAFMQKLFKVNRLKNIDYPLCKTQNWFSITGECASYVLSKRDFIEGFVKFTCCADEMFLGTIIVNSIYRDQIYEPYRSPGGHMRLIDRERPEGASPHTLTMDDWDMIRQCPHFWARKFDMNKDSNIIDKVFETWH